MHGNGHWCISSQASRQKHAMCSDRTSVRRNNNSAASRGAHDTLATRRITLRPLASMCGSSKARFRNKRENLCGFFCLRLVVSYSRPSVTRVCVRPAAHIVRLTSPPAARALSVRQDLSASLPQGKHLSISYHECPQFVP